MKDVEEKEEEEEEDQGTETAAVKVATALSGVEVSCVLVGARRASLLMSRPNTPSPYRSAAVNVATALSGVGVSCVFVGARFPATSQLLAVAHRPTKVVCCAALVTRALIRPHVVPPHRRWRRTAKARAGAAAAQRHASTSRNACTSGSPHAALHLTHLRGVGGGSLFFWDQRRRP